MECDWIWRIWWSGVVIGFGRFVVVDLEFRNYGFECFCIIVVLIDKWMEFVCLSWSIV